MKLPLFTLLLVLANLLSYALELVDGGQATCERLGLVPARFMRSGDLEPLISSLFFHDPNSLGHLFGNMAFLAVFGAIVEGALGHFRFLAIYLAAGVLGGLMHVLVDPSATIPLVGASGAVFGVLAVTGALRPRLLGFVIAFVGLNVWNAFTGDTSGVSFGCHLGGFFAGVVAVLALKVAGSEALETA